MKSNEGILSDCNLRCRGSDVNVEKAVIVNAKMFGGYSFYRIGVLLGDGGNYSDWVRKIKEIRNSRMFHVESYTEMDVGGSD